MKIRMLRVVSFLLIVFAGSAFLTLTTAQVRKGRMNAIAKCPGPNQHDGPFKITSTVTGPDGKVIGTHSMSAIYLCPAGTAGLQINVNYDKTWKYTEIW
jgi:hypothetical protein